MRFSCFGVIVLVFALVWTVASDNVKSTTKERITTVGEGLDHGVDVDLRICLINSVPEYSKYITI